MTKSLKEWMARVTNALGGFVIYKNGITSTLTSSDGWAEYIYDTSLGMNNNLDRYIWFVYNEGWSRRVEVQASAPDRLTLRSWELSSPNGSQVTLLKNTHVTVNLVGILKPEFVGGGTA